MITEDDWKEYVALVIAKLDEWFWVIENGETRLPDPAGKRYDEEFVDEVLHVVDTFIENEITLHPGYWLQGGYQSRYGSIDLPADFNRLQGATREAFVQDLMTVLDHKFKNWNHREEDEIVGVAI